MTLIRKTFENIVGKRENAGNQHFLFFPQCFLPFHKQTSIFETTFILSSANAFKFNQFKILSLKTLKEKAYENIVGKGENTSNQQFLLFSQCLLAYHRQVLPFKPNSNYLLQTLPQTSPGFYVSAVEVF